MGRPPLRLRVPVRGDLSVPVVLGQRVPRDRAPARRSRARQAGGALLDAGRAAGRLHPAHAPLGEERARRRAPRVLDHARAHLLHRDDPAAGHRARGGPDLRGDRRRRLRARGAAADPPLLPLAQGLPRSGRRRARRDRPDRTRPAETLPQLRVSMKRLFDAYAPLRADPARLLALDVFVWEDVMVNVIYADGLRALGGLCLVAGFSDIEAREREARARRVVHALQEKCWDDRAGAFWDLDGWDEERARVLTFSSLFPIVLADLDPVIAQRVVEDHLLNEREFWLPFPIPTVAASEPSFDPGWATRTTWRGPTWINVNWYLYHGLRAHGYREIASELAERTFAMVAKSGIREFYDPRNADGQGAVDFGWSCLVLDLIAAEGRPLQ